MKVLLVFLMISSIFFVHADVDDSFEDEFSTSEVAKQAFDPFHGYNTMMTGFNDAFYTGLLIPTAKGYRYIVPKEGRKSVSNVFDNLLSPGF